MCLLWQTHWHQEKLLKDPDFERSFSQLLDFTNVTDVELSAEEIRKLAQTTVFSANSRRAFVVNNDLKFGLAPMFAVFRETLGEKGIRIFRNPGSEMRALDRQITHIGLRPYPACPFRTRSVSESALLLGASSAQSSIRRDKKTTSK